MAGMVAHPGQALDDGGHPGQGPQSGAKSVRPRPPAQRTVNPLQLLAIQFRFASRSAGTMQGLRPALPPAPVPATDTLAAHPECPGDRRQPLAGAEPLGGLLAPVFQGLEIPSRTNRLLHASSIREVLAFVTVLCECQ